MAWTASGMGLPPRTRTPSISNANAKSLLVTGDGVDKGVVTWEESPSYEEVVSELTGSVTIVLLE
jgi:hypothetical protein